MTYRLLFGDCRETLAELEADSLDALVTDPPYGLSDKPPDLTEILPHWLRGDDAEHTGKGFMGREWDRFVPGPATWREVLRVLKPGAYGVVFAGSRTQDLMSVSLRLAGFEVRDTLFWLYGSGFPKSLDVGKAVDAQDRAEEARRRALQFTAWMRSTGVPAAALSEATGTNMGGHWRTDAAQPRIPTPELFELVRPLLPPVPSEIEALVHDRAVESENLAARAVVGIRVDGASSRGDRAVPVLNGNGVHYYTAPYTPEAKRWGGYGTALKPAYEPIILVRKPMPGTVAANVLRYGTGAIDVAGCRVPSDEQHREKCASVVGLSSNRSGACFGEWSGARGDSYDERGRWPANIITDGLEGEEWARYFYSAKASRRDREEGCEALEAVRRSDGREKDIENPRLRTTERHNRHPTVKPTDLMRWLVRLVTPHDGQVLDPFAGSGSTGKAAILEGKRPVLCEMTPAYWPIIMARCDWAEKQL